MFWKKDKRKQDIIGPGKRAGISVPLPHDAKGTEVVTQYGDEFGNEYETRITFDLKNRKIVKQEHKMIKKVKDLPEGDQPRLVLDENSINWPDIT